MPSLASKIIVTVNTNTAGGCPLCNSEGQHFNLDGENFDDSCNHLLQAHKLKCLHVGQETSRDNAGKPWQSTVAVFGL